MCCVVINGKFKLWELVLFSPELELIDSSQNLNFNSYGSHTLKVALQCNVINYDGTIGFISFMQFVREC